MVDIDLNGGMAKGNKSMGVKPKGKCFYYGMLGHLKRNCPDYLLKKKTTSMIESLVSEVSFTTNTSESRCVDSGTNNHICNSLQGFWKTWRLSGGDIIINLGSKAKT
eukprot:TRINITY_DN92055_c0_g1_i1.p1 TRINITY_DN92055_c0_g1~~TRINITY_DN92055_c0_g1_i1.p1  ORF type:complete len:107 (-),score=4.74 TRINITY_DN92055_c0_g1_i1:29-349(-)